MAITVLGELRLDGEALSPRERVFLATLVMRAGRPVSPGELADAYWGESPPATWAKQVQAAIGRLRRRLGPSSIVTGPGGYTLAADPETIDAGRFERLVAAARVHLAEGEPDRAAAALESALGLWRGEPYADLIAWPDARGESARLGELFAAAREDLLRARLERGDRDSVVAEAERLVAEQPLRESRWVLLATALYRAGRQADALAAVRLARRRLDEELGVALGAELTDLEVAILRHDPALDPPVAETASEECPYRGLRAFDAEDEAAFFGREEEVAAALDRLARSRFLTLVGPSGCGKSSLVRAGVAPSLRRRGLSVRVLTPAAQGGNRLHEALVHAAADVLVVDQLEEMFHRGLPDDEVTALCGRIAAYPGTVVLTVRSDFLDDCAAQPPLAPLLAEGVRLVTPMTEAQLRAAITEPARLSGLRLEHGLVELVLRDAAGAPGVLPHVSHALVETWLRREGPVLTIDGYEASGGISGAIAQSADRLYQSLGPDERELCRSTLLRLVSLAPDGSPVRQRLRLGPLRADQPREQLLSRLASARLVSTEGDSVVVAHEAVALAWPRLRDWLLESADDVRRMAALAGAAERWEADGEPVEDLYRGARLEAALELQATATLDLTPVERRFLLESRRSEDVRLAELRDRARREARQNRRLRGLLVTALVLLLCTSIAAGALVAANREATRQREEATVEALVARSLALREEQRDVAALLAAEAYRRWPDDPRSRQALMGTVTSAGGFLGVSYLSGSSAEPGAGIAQEGAYLVIRDGGVAVVGTAGETRASADVDWGTSGSGVGTPLVAVSADGRTGVIARGVGPGTAAAGPRTVLVVLDLPSLHQRGAPLTVRSEAGSLAVAPDGGWAALGSATQGLVTAVDLEDRSVVRRPLEVDRVPSEWASATLVAATERGQLLVSGAFQTLRLFDPDRLRVVEEVAVPKGVADVALDTDGPTIVASGSDRLMMATPGLQRIRWSTPFPTDHPAPCPFLEVSREADAVLCGDHFGNLERRDLRTGLEVEIPDAQLGAVGPLLISEDGSTAAALGAGIPAISRWRLDGAGPVSTLVASGSVVYEGWDATDTTFLVARRPDRADEYDDLQRFALWDPAEDAATFLVPGKAEGVGWAGTGILTGWSHRAGGVAFLDTVRGEWYRNDPRLDSAGRLWPGASGTVAYASFPDGSVVSVDPRTGRRTGSDVPVGGNVYSVSESPDGTRIATASWNDGWEVSVHDLATGAVVVDGLEGPQLVAFAPDGELYAAQEGRITRYDPTDLHRLGTLPGTHGEINSLQFSRDGSLLLATANDQTATLYDVTTALRLGDPIRTAAPLIIPAWLRPDGELLAVTVTEGVQVWDLDPSQQFDAACRLAGRELTPEEWDSYLGTDISQVATCADVLGPG